MNSINRYGIKLRLVELNDAEFIFDLRTDPDLNQFISFTGPKIEDQIKWLKEYKVRESKGLEYYYITEANDGHKYGTIRLYNFDERSFELGSWVFKPKSPLGIAVKTHFIGFEIGFEMLKLEYGRIEIRKKNLPVLKYIREFKPILIKEDELNYYFILTKENFYKRKEQLPIFSSYQNKKNYTIHPTAEVQTTKIGEGTVIWQYCIVLNGAVIGKNCNLNYNVFIENDVIIGDNVTVKSGVQLWDGIRLEDNVFISPNVTFTNDFSPRSKQYPEEFLKTIVKEGASIGANSTIIGGLTIGRYSMIGAGSVVTKNIPDFTLWYGVPATFKGYICKCGHKLDDSLNCASCKKKYININGIIETHD
jgi:acetyltransferase-like isoleucine patch superfamily enzyme